jgi:predicted alpha/beta hydrolase
VELPHPDGTKLGATLFHGGDRGWVVVGGATGVPQVYYRHLAEWLAETQRLNVLTFDYRGIGASKPTSLRGFAADLRTWASDLRAAVDYAADRGPTAVVGHSFGGHAFGMTEGHRRTVGLYTFGSGSGWSGWMPTAEQWRVWSL